MCRTSLLVALSALAIPLGVGSVASAAPGPAAAAVPNPAPLSKEAQEQARLREEAAAGALEGSSAAVQAAGVALQAIAAEMPIAEQNVAKAKGELAGAQAKLAAARTAVEQAEAARTAAEQRVSEAGARVQEGREQVGQLARRSYQRGRLGALQDVIEAGEPQDVLERASMLRSVFRYQDGTLDRLTRDRLTLSRTEADLGAEARAVERARVAAAQGEERARQITGEAEAAAARVTQLIAERRAVLVAAEANRAQDQRDYQAAQAESRELAERIRRAAAEAAAAEARRRAAEEARRKAAEAAAAAAFRQQVERAARANRPAPPPPAPAAPPASAGQRAGQMKWPAPGRLTSRYGMRKHPIYGDYRFHAGIDIGGGAGAPIWAAESGTVILAGRSGGYGNLVVITHGTVNGKNLTTAYAHQSTILVREGQSVSKGQQIGRIGNTGASAGPHLHFEVRRDGDPVNPLDYVTPP